MPKSLLPHGPRDILKPSTPEGEHMNKLISSVIQGLREGPIVFVAPIVAAWRALNTTAHELLHEAGTR